VIGDKRGPTTPAAVVARWIHHFNAHDVTSLVQLYAEGGRHTSPRIRALHPETDGDLVGRSALATWWETSLRQTPGLHYETLAIVGDESRAFVEYIRRAPGEPDRVVVERFDVQNGQIVSSRVFL
jgi:SnoaL-like domain